MNILANPTAKVVRAFKEWAVIVDALGKGEQTLIIRKGGIHEEGRRFQADQDEFFLFPTFEHQNPEDLEPLLRDHLSRIVQSKPREGIIPIDCVASVREIFKIEDRERLSKIKKYHLWSASCVENRFDWGREKSVTVLLVRVFKLPRRFEIPMRESYGGCKSWVTLEAEIPVEGSKVVLSDDEFERVRRGVRTILNTSSCHPERSEGSSSQDPSSLRSSG